MITLHKKYIEKPEGTIKNGQSRNSGHVGNWIQHEDKQNKRQNKEKLIIGGVV